MTEELKQFERAIKKKHIFAWTPKYEVYFRTNLNETVFIPIVIETFEKLGWELVYQDETTAEANSPMDWSQWGHRITVKYEYGKVTVKSVSLGNEFWDNGRNSKRVKLFIYAFRQIEKGYDRAALAELEKEVERANNWDDYTVPETLPPPVKQGPPRFWIPVLGGIMTALLMGFVVAFLTVKVTYIIFLFEVGVAFVFGFVLKHLIRMGNYTNDDYLHHLLIGMILITYLSNQYFQYQIILQENDFAPIGFWAFMKLRLEAGLMVKELNTGWIGLVISWVLQLVITYIVGTMRVASNLATYRLERIPEAVIEFTIYHFAKEKTEEQVRGELSKMDWSDPKDQDEVFECLGAIQDAQEMNRM